MPDQLSYDINDGLPHPAPKAADPKGGKEMSAARSAVSTSTLIG
ncbi:hypothetical protein [Streptomyces sp. TP-A0356]|nr:hypothetical protein [Streptomyces sp. TP-A0356]